MCRGKDERMNESKGYLAREGKREREGKGGRGRKMTGLDDARGNCACSREE